MTMDKTFLVSSKNDRIYYENILIETDSIEFQRFYNNRMDLKNHSYSKASILRIISQRDWGLNLIILRTLTKSPYVEYNYFDYIDTWYNAFLYNNSSLGHT